MSDAPRKYEYPPWATVKWPDRQRGLVRIRGVLPVVRDPRVRKRLAWLEGLSGLGPIHAVPLQVTVQRDTLIRAVQTMKAEAKARSEKTPLWMDWPEPVEWALDLTSQLGALALRFRDAASSEERTRGGPYPRRVVVCHAGWCPAWWPRSRTKQCTCPSQPIPYPYTIHIGRDALRSLVLALGTNEWALPTAEELAQPGRRRGERWTARDQLAMAARTFFPPELTRWAERRPRGVQLRRQSFKVTAAILWVAAEQLVRAARGDHQLRRDLMVLLDQPYTTWEDSVIAANLVKRAFPPEWGTWVKALDVSDMEAEVNVALLFQQREDAETAHRARQSSRRLLLGPPGQVRPLP